MDAPYVNNLDFGQAIKNLKAGKKVARAGWNGKGMFLRYIAGGTFTIDEETYPALPFIQMKTAQGDVVPWLASQTDVLAEDWEIVE